MRALELLGGLAVAIAIGIGAYRMLVVMSRGINETIKHNDEEK